MHKLRNKFIKRGNLTMIMVIAVTVILVMSALVSYLASSMNLHMKTSQNLQVYIDSDMAADVIELRMHDLIVETFTEDIPAEDFLLANKETLLAKLNTYIPSDSHVQNLDMVVADIEEEFNETTHFYECIVVYFEIIIDNKSEICSVAFFIDNTEPYENPGHTYLKGDHVKTWKSQ